MWVQQPASVYPLSRIELAFSMPAKKQVDSQQLNEVSIAVGQPLVTLATAALSRIS